MKTGLVGSVLVPVLFATGMILSALALFTDTASVPSNTITAGTVDITTSPTSVFISFSDMAPGDKVDSQLQVSNINGTIELRYAVTVSSTNADAKNLRDALVMTVKKKEGPSCTGIIDDATKPTLYSGSLNPLSGKLLGDPAQGAQAGDRVLAGGAEEDLCFRVQLPVGSGNAYQNASTTATFTFDAEQTANNP